MSQGQPRRLSIRPALVLSVAAFAMLIAATPSWAYHVLQSGGDGPGVQRWVAGIDDLNEGEVFIPIELDAGDPSVAYLNVAIDFDGNSVYAPYLGSAGVQNEWVIQNLPIEVPSGPGDYYGGFFALTDVSAKSGSHPADIWVSSTPLAAPIPATGTLSTILSMGVFDRDQFGTPSTDGPSGGATPSGRGQPIVPSGASSMRPAAATASATRALPDRQQQIDSECFITSVAMSMKWLAATYPNLFQVALPAIADLITAMKQTNEWKTYNIVRWGHLFEWKNTIFNQYKGAATIKQWNGTDDPYTWMKGELDHGEDVEMSMGYKPVANNDGHTVILTGWAEDGINKYVTCVDPLEPNKNGRQFNKRIKVTGTDVDYPSKNGTAIREIDSESPANAVPTEPTTWGRVKGKYR